MPKQLFRSKINCVLGGVAGGLAEYFDVDVVLIRAIWVIFALCAGGGVLAYAICWIIIPKNPYQAGYLGRSESCCTGTSEVRGADSGEAGEAGSGPEVSSPPIRETEGFRGRHQSVGLILIALGLLFLLRNFFPRFFYWNDLWPLLLIVLGVALLWKSFDKGGKC